MNPMKKRVILNIAALLMGCSLWAEVVVTPSEVIGKIKPMNGVNNGPAGPFGEGDSQTRDNYADFKAAKFPFVRTHDSAFSESYGSEHTVDITAIFPDFDRKTSDPDAYHFEITDWYLKRVREEGGSEIFFRLGQKIEHHVRKYGILPPKDAKKWAEICEHIIRHYNEGWKNGYHWNIRYWEIWNEADLDEHTWNKNPKTWAGPKEQFFELYATTAKHLKKCFPQLMIGGPALAGRMEWADQFLAYQKKEGTPIDFFSWHIYSTNPQAMAQKAGKVRELVDKYGYTKAETILNEWNYIRGWTGDFPYSIKAMRNIKGAAFTASAMIACQHSPLDIMMYYDARPETPFNGLFDFYTMQPTPVYYSFYAWSRLASLGQEVRATAEEKDLSVVAAKGEDGTVRTLVTRYNDDDNESLCLWVNVKIQGAKDGEVVCHVVNEHKLYSETLKEIKDGNLMLVMEPNSVYLIETKE